MRGVQHKSKLCLETSPRRKKAVKNMRRADSLSSVD
jgi:hypothetical protein